MNLRERKLIPAYEYPVSTAIRSFLISNKKASPSEFYHMYKPFKESVSYLSVCRYFWILKERGLIKVVSHEIKPEEDKSSRIPKTFYAVVPERLEDEMWLHPQRMFPSIEKRGSVKRQNDKRSE